MLLMDVDGDFILDILSLSSGSRGGTGNIFDVVVFSFLLLAFFFSCVWLLLIWVLEAQS